jgi:hypothetical protein
MLMQEYLITVRQKTSRSKSPITSLHKKFHAFMETEISLPC